VAEITQDVVRAASFFEEVNDGVLKNPRMSLVVLDAREFMLLQRGKYDVVVSEPTNVWVPGVASLFTEDFYRVVLSRLEPGGLFTQWIQLYSSEPRIVSSVTASLRRVFPWVTVWMGEEPDLLFLAGREPPRFDPEAFARRIRDVRPAEGLASRNPRVERLGDPVLFLLSQVATDEGSRRFWEKSGAPPYRDHFPRMEFLAARAQFVGRSYAIFSDLDERITPLGSEPLFLTEYLKARPLSAEDLGRLRRKVARQSGAFGAVGRSLMAHSVLEGEGSALDVLSLPEGLQARLLLARSLEPRLEADASVEVCNAYLGALGNVLAEASSVLARPSTATFVKHAEECIARHRDVALPWRRGLVKVLSGAGAREEALARLEALDAEGLVDNAEPAERVELAAIGSRLALVLGRTEAAARWSARGEALRQ
jgi:hypothetical protein